MENKRKNLAEVFIFSLFLLIALTTKCAEGAFIGEQIISDGISPPYEPNYPFYFDNLLHLVIGVQNAFTGAEALLAQYNSGGTIVRNISFPLPCFSQCTIEGAVFGLVNNSAYISLRRSENRNEWACMIYQVDLPSFQIVNTSAILNSTNSYYCSYSLPTWTPYNSTHSMFSEHWFEYETLSFNPNEYSYIIPYNNLGGSSTALSDENLIIYQQMDGYSEYFVTENVETYRQEKIDLTEGTMMVFLGDNSTNVAITTFAYDYKLRNYGSNITLLDATEILKFTSSNTLSGIYPQTGMFGDSSNNIFYIANLESGDEKGAVISQYNVNVASNTHTQLDTLTLVNYESPQFYPAFFSVLSWGLNEPTQQFAIVTKDISTNVLGLHLIDYDNSLASYDN